MDLKYKTELNEKELESLKDIFRKSINVGSDSVLSWFLSRDYLVSVFDDEKIIGGAIGMKKDGLAYLNAIAVDKENRGEGVGKKLLNYFEKIVFEKEKGINLDTVRPTWFLNRGYEIVDMYGNFCEMQKGKAKVEKKGELFGLGSLL